MEWYGGMGVPIREIFTDILKTASICTFPMYIYSIHNIMCALYTKQTPVAYHTAMISNSQKGSSEPHFNLIAIVQIEATSPHLFAKAPDSP